MTVTLTGFDHPVSWQEFSTVEARPDNSSEDAYVQALTAVPYDYAEQGGTWRVTAVRATITVNGATSWVVEGEDTDALLAHEQGHFDITAIGMREEANLVMAITANSERRLRRRRDNVRSDIQGRTAAANRLYDTRTEHGRDPTAQRRWNNSIRAAKNDANGTLADLPD